MRQVRLLLLGMCAFTLIVGLFGSQALAQERPTKIAFSRDGQVLVMNPDGSGVVTLAGGGDQGNCYGPCWSPSGGAIAFSSTRSVEQGADLYMMYADGSNQVQLTGHYQENDEWSEWSPLGDRIAFTAYALYLLDLPTGAEWFEFPDDPNHWDASPSWSPDGNLIAFYRQGEGVYVAPAAGGTPWLVVQYGGPVDWSPAGGWLTYPSLDGNRNIWKIPIDTNGTVGEPVNLTNHGGEYYDEQPTWSPDGDWIAFQRRTWTGKRFGPNHIVTMDANGGNLQDLGLGQNPEWSPWLDTVPPVAVAAGPATGVVLTPLNFNGSSSTDPDGTIERYVWDFGDGSPRVEGEVPEPHTFLRAGTYEVRLIVVDDDRVPDMDFLDVTIEGGDNWPVADAGGPYAGYVGYEVAFDGSASYDPDGDPLWYQWDFGDGSLSDWTTEPTAGHTYAVSDIYDVVLWVDDDANHDVGVLPSVPTTATITLAPTLHVSAIDMSVAKVSGKWRATAVVTVKDAFDAPVSGAAVSGAWTGAYNASASGTTNTSGQVTFTSGLVKGSGLTFTFTVNDVVKTGYLYVPGPGGDSNSITTP